VTRSWVRVWAVFALLVIVLAPAVLQAQPSQVDEFRSISPEELAAGQEQIPAAQLVFAAYGIVWLAFAFYLLSLWRRVSQVEVELRAVAGKLEKTAR
jgi:CcmD family protein